MYASRLGKGAESSLNSICNRIVVWWNIETCSLPSGTDAIPIVDHVQEALSSVGLQDPITISAFGDIRNLSPFVSESLTNAGVNLHHVPAGRKDNTDKAILVNLLLWASENPPPANIFLISGDADFSNALHSLRMKGYTILLAYPEERKNVFQSLISSASFTWGWSALIKGNFIRSLPQPTPISFEPHQNWVEEVLEYLRSENISPTASNIWAAYNWKYMPTDPEFDFASLLQEAVISGDLWYHSMGETFLLLPPELFRCWDCIDLNLTNDSYPRMVWDAMENFLKYSFDEIKECKSRFEIAQYLQSSGPFELRHLSLGKIMNIIYLSECKNWIKRHSPTQYGPIEVTLPPTLHPNQPFDLNLPHQDSSNLHEACKTMPQTINDVQSQGLSNPPNIAPLINDLTNDLKGKEKFDEGVTLIRIRECLHEILKVCKPESKIHLSVAKSQMEKLLGKTIAYKSYGYSSFSSLLKREFSDLVEIKTNDLVPLHPCPQTNITAQASTSNSKKLDLKKKSGEGITLTRIRENLIKVCKLYKPKSRITKLMAISKLHKFLKKSNFKSLGYSSFSSLLRREFSDLVKIKANNMIEIQPFP